MKTYLKSIIVLTLLFYNSILYSQSIENINCQNENSITPKSGIRYRDSEQKGDVSISQSKSNLIETKENAFIQESFDMHGILGRAKLSDIYISSTRESENSDEVLSNRISQISKSQEKLGDLREKDEPSHQTIFIPEKSTKAVEVIYSQDFEADFSADGLLGTTATAGWYASVQPASCGENYWGVYSTGSFVINGRSLMIVAVDAGCTFYPGEYHVNYVTDKFAYVTIDGSGYETLTLDFDWRSNGEIFSGTYYDYGTVLYRAGTSGTWLTLNTGGNDGLGKYAGQTGVQNESLNLPAGIEDGVFQVAFSWKNDNVDGTWESFVIDNIVVSGSAIVVGSPPVCSTPVMPANGSTGYTPGDPLEWNSVSGAVSYDVYFGTSSNPPLVSNTTSLTYTPSMADNTTYYWKIVPKNAFGSASGCSVWTFETGTGPISGDYRTRYLTGPYGWNNPDNWEQFNGSSWVVAATLPSETNNVTIRENSQYVVLNSPLTSTGEPAKCDNLRVDGTLQFWNGLDPSTDAYGDVNISGDLNIMSTGVFETFVNVTGIEAVSAINLVNGGNVNNYGTLDLYNETNSSSFTSGWLNFYGSSTSSLNLQPSSTTKFFYIQVAKDNPGDIVNININEDFLAVNDENSGNNGFIKSYNMNSWDETPQGHIVIGGTYSKNNPVWFQGLNTFSLGFNTSNGIASNLTVEVDNPNFGVMAQDVTFNLGGTLKISQGQVDIGATSGNVAGVDQSSYYLNILNGGSLIVDGGALNTRAGIAGTGTHSFTMTGGTVNVGRNANASVRGLFDLQGTPQVTISDGIINITDPRYTITNLGYRVDDGTTNITGGKLYIGSMLSPAGSNTFSISGHVPSIELYGNGTTIASNAILWDNVQCYGDLDIPEFCGLSIYDQDNGDTPYTFSITGNINHEGNFYAEVEDSKILFNGTSTQTFHTTGAYNDTEGTAGISVVEVDNSTGVQLTGSSTAVTKNMISTDGTFNIGDCSLGLCGIVTRTGGYLGGNENSELYIYGEGELGNLFFDPLLDSLKVLDLDRTNSGTAFLATNLNIQESLNFTNGIFYTYMDGNRANGVDSVYLASDALLVNENASSYIIGAVSISNEISLQTTINSPEEFDSDILVHGFSAPNTVWFAPDSNTEIGHLPTGGCTDGRIGYSGNWNSFWGNFVRLPEADCSTYDNIVLSFDVSNSYFASHPNDWSRFYMWADAGYEHNVTSVKIDGVDVTYDSGANGKGFKFSEVRSCASVEVTFDISAIVDKTNILFYLEPSCGYNNSNAFYVYFDNIALSGLESSGAGSDFGNVWAIMQNVSDNLGNVKVTRITGLDGIQSVDGDESISCYWDIDVENQPLAPIDMTFKWLDTFDNSLATTDLSVWKKDGVNPWEERCNQTSVSGNPRTINATADSFSRWSVTEKATPLPVEWGELKCICDNRDLILTWQTFSEINSDYFEIEYSNDAMNFKKIGIKKAAGNSVLVNNYEFDYQSSYSGNHYLRLKQFDFDGKYSYSEIIQSDCNTEEIVFSVFPNPFDGSVFNVTVSNTVEDVDIELFDASGRIVYKNSIPGINGDFTVDIKGKLEIGIYLLVIKSNTKVYLIDKLIVN